MVNLSLKFSVHGYRFHEGVKALEEAFNSASDTLETKLAAKQRELDDYVKHIEQGGKPIGEWDDEGNRLWEQDDLLTIHIETASEAVMALRKSTAIALYHHWERTVRKAAAHTGRNHGALLAAAEREGIKVDPMLEAVRCLVNLLKHDNEDWAEKLRVLWPDILSGFNGKSNFSDWYQAVQMTREQVNQVFGIIKASGPVTMSPSGIVAPISI